MAWLASSQISGELEAFSAVPCPLATQAESPGFPFKKCNRQLEVGATKSTSTQWFAENIRERHKLALWENEDQAAGRAHSLWAMAEGPSGPRQEEEKGLP